MTTTMRLGIHKIYKLLQYTFFEEDTTLNIEIILFLLLNLFNKNLEKKFPLSNFFLQSE